MSRILSLVVMLLAVACSDGTISPETVEAGPDTLREPVTPPTPPAPPPPVGVPPTSKYSRTYASVDSPYYANHGSPLGSRYVLFGDGTFSLQYSSANYPFFEYRGTYREMGGKVVFNWPIGMHEWTAEADISADRLTVRYNSTMSLSDFLDGTYLRVEAPSQLELTPREITLFDVSDFAPGNSVHMSVSARDESGNAVPLPFAPVFSTSDARIAVVDSAGRVTALRPGTVEISASVRDCGRSIRGAAVVTVHRPPLALRFVDQPDAFTARGQLRAIRVAATMLNGVTHPTFDDTIAIALTRHGHSAVITGGLRTAAFNGVARFHDLAIGDASPGYRLIASATWANDGTSHAFHVIDPRAGKLALHYCVDSDACAAGGGIAVVDADGSSERRLTSDWTDSNPSWSRDGNSIAFDSGRHCSNHNFCQSEIYVMNTDGSGIARMTHQQQAASYHPTWSPDGRKIAFVKTQMNLVDGHIDWGPSELVTMQADAVGQQVLARNTSIFQPAWSPTGDAIVFISRATRGIGADKLQIVHDSHVFTLAAAQELRAPTWSPDGLRIAFVRASMNRCELLIIDAAGSVKTAAQLDFCIDNLAWSADGNMLAFTTTVYPFALGLLSPDGTGTTIIKKDIAGGRMSWSDHH